MAFVDFVPAEVLAAQKLEEVEESWRCNLDDPQHFVFVAFVADRPVRLIIGGVREIMPVPAAYGHIFSLYVDAEHCRKSIGQELLKMAARHWIGGGHGSLSVGVLKQNIRARQFYEAMGAVLSGEGMFTWDGHELPECCYHREITAVLDVS